MSTSANRTDSNLDEGSPVISAEAQLDREKFEFDKAMRTQEIALKKQEEDRLATELEIKRQDSLRSRWTNPFVVAIIGAILVGIGNVALSAFNGSSQRRLENSTAMHQRELAEAANNYTVALESIREENASVLEIVKLGDPEKIRAGLCMLVKLNSIKSPSTSNAVQSYIAEHHGCSTLQEATPAERKTDWVTAQATIPGCGESGCYADVRVCGSAPTNTKPTGIVRNYTDTFGGAWGAWLGPGPAVTSTQVCQVFQQHSHNITRTVSFQFEVAPVP